MADSIIQVPHSFLCLKACLLNSRIWLLSTTPTLAAGCRDAAVVVISRLLHQLAAYPNIKTLELPLPANTACIAALAHLPGLRHLTLTLFHPKPLPGGVTDPSTDLSADAREELLGAVLEAATQVTHLEVEHHGADFLAGDVPIPPQLQKCTQLQEYRSKSLPMLVCKPEHWAYLAGAKELRECLPAVTIAVPPPSGTCLTHLAAAWLVPNRLEDLQLMLAALPALEAARVVLYDDMDLAHDGEQVRQGGRGGQADCGWLLQQSIEQAGACLRWCSHLCRPMHMHSPNTKERMCAVYTSLSLLYCMHVQHEWTVLPACTTHAANSHSPPFRLYAPGHPHPSLQVFVSKTLRELDVECSEFLPPAAQMSCCKALLTGSFPQLKQLGLRFGPWESPLRVPGNLSGFPCLTKLSIHGVESEYGAVVLKALWPIIWSGKGIEELDFHWHVYRPVPHCKLVGLIKNMPRLKQLRYNMDMVAELSMDMATLESVAARSGVELVCVDAEEEEAMEEEEEEEEEEMMEEEDEFEDEYEEEFEEESEEESEEVDS
jgi:hypothetical protein